MKPETREWLRNMFQYALIVAVTYFAARYGVPLPIPAPPTIVTVPVQPAIPLPKQDDTVINHVLKARVKISGCSATVIVNPNKPSEKLILSAAHCVSRVGQRVTCKFSDDSTADGVVIALNKSSDIAIIRAPIPSTIEGVTVAVAKPTIGTEVYHAGFGTDNPGNTERGKVTGYTNYGKDIICDLSVSYGDSGTGIFDCTTNELVCMCSRASGNTHTGPSCESVITVTNGKTVTRRPFFRR